MLAGSACGLAGQSAQAIQLGELQVQSALGQPLRASIAYALSSNEQIHDYCIFIRPGAAAQGLPALSQARISLSGSRINITGNLPLREPMLAIGLTVDCPYSANLTRSYTLLLDPVPATRSVATVQPAPAPVVQNNTATQSIVARRTAAPAAVAEPVPLTGTYRVRIGDTLSDIAARIENRPVGLWQAAAALFDANPSAFVDGDMNRLKAGALLTLPSFDGTSVTSIGELEPVSEPAAVAQPSATGAAENAATNSYGGADLSSPAAEPAARPVPEPVTEPTESAENAAVASTETPATTPVSDQTGDLQPGDVQMGNDQAFVSPIDSSPATAEEPPISEPVIGVDAAGEGNPQLLYWLGGTGLALFLGFVAFRSRSRFTGPAAPADSQADAAVNKPLEETGIQETRKPDIDFDIGVQADTQRQLVLDADLTEGTGLRDNSDVEVAEDFGFSTSHDVVTLDLDVGDDEEVSGATITGERPTTDMLPTHRFVEESILDREILPSDEEYDLSMVVDATKQEFNDGDVTAKDLMAIAVTQEMPELGSAGDEYTLNKDVDYKILEQDYEEELTATQALNAEIVKAATELADNLGESTDDTAKIARAEDSLAITAVQESGAGENDGDAVDDDYDDEETEILTDLDDTGINEALVEDTQEFTAEMPMRRSTDTLKQLRPDSLESTFEGTAELPARHSDADVHELSGETTSTTALTEELPTAENDPTLEMDVESGRFRTKKLVG